MPLLFDPDDTLYICSMLSKEGDLLDTFYAASRGPRKLNDSSFKALTFLFMMLKTI